MADGTNDLVTQLFFSLPSKGADLEKKVMWVGVKNHVARDEKCWVSEVIFIFISRKVKK